MKKSEMNIIIGKFDELLTMNENGFDKNDAIFELKCLMYSLNLVNEYKVVENNHFIKNHGLKFMQIEGYATLLDILMKYNGGKVVEYENLVSTVDMWVDEMSNEHQKNVAACINMIENY